MILDKLFNKNKLPKYFLEIISDDDDDKEESKSETLEVPTPVAPTTSVETLTNDDSQVKPSKTEAKDNSKAKATKTKAKDNSKAKATKTEAKPAEAPAPTPVNYDPPEWVKAIKNYSDGSGNGIGNSSGTENNFAGKYVSNNVASARRRPGGSLNKFKDMASKVGK